MGNAFGPQDRTVSPGAGRPQPFEAAMNIQVTPARPARRTQCGSGAKGRPRAGDARNRRHPHRRARRVAQGLCRRRALPRHPRPLPRGRRPSVGQRAARHHLRQLRPLHRPDRDHRHQARPAAREVVVATGSRRHRPGRRAARGQARGQRPRQRQEPGSPVRPPRTTASSRASRAAR